MSIMSIALWFFLLAHVFWVKFSHKMTLRHIAVDTAISPTAALLSLKVQIQREKPCLLGVFNIALTTVSFLHAVIK